MPVMEPGSHSDGIKSWNIQKQMNEYVQDLYFTENFGVAEGWPATGVVFTDQDEFIVAELRSGTFTDHVHWTWPKKELWVKGTFHITVWFAPDKAEVDKNIVMHTHLQAWPLGGTTPIDLLLNSAQTVSVPNTISELSSFTCTSTTAVAFNDYPIVSLEVFRDAANAADTFGTSPADHIHLYGVRVEYRPSQSQ
jgi:hypothetical protein